MVLFFWPICSKPGSTTLANVWRAGELVDELQDHGTASKQTRLCVVRQSTMGQVRHQSTERQYAQYENNFDFVMG
jgi:hypothetical protein